MNEAELFAAAVAIADQTERSALLDAECAGRPEARERIQALLNEYFSGGATVDSPIEERTAAHVPAEQPGAIVAGRYKLLEEIGEGGMGTVWVAEQIEPVRRKVALKLIKAGMDSRTVLARFDAERQALALMDHPHIAKVLDGGLTASGRPYFAMEYVRGAPINEYCDSARLSVAERLELFAQVCQAVQHAHQKGIIHRDLKPSNILVALGDGRPAPKIIDFGLAKAMHQSLTEKTLHTAQEAVLGTPLYMSPEQAHLNNLDVDTRSDIYSLGVVLYELLTGTTPLERQRFRVAAWEEIRRIIREEEPPRPSTRLSSSNSLPSLAACRQSEPVRLTKQIRGELDWIVMKALEKDRARRYDTANAFAIDVLRFLSGEPVSAVPPSAGYRLRKFTRRHRGILATSAFLAAFLVSAAAFSAWQAIRASEARELAELRRDEAEAESKRAKAARQAEEDAKNKAIDAQADAESRREEAERAREVTKQQRRLALDTVRDVLLRVDDLMKNDAQLAPLRIEIIRRMVADVDRIRDHALKNPLEDRTEAVAFSRLGEIYFRANRFEDAKVWYDKAYAALEELARAMPDDPNAQSNLAVISRFVANVDWRLGNGVRSRELRSQDLNLRRTALALLQTAATRDELAIATAQYEVAESLRLLANDDLYRGEPAVAIEQFVAADKAFADLPLPLPNLLQTRRNRAEIKVRLADAHARIGNLVEAEKLFRASLEDREALAKSLPQPAAAALLKCDLGQGRMYLGDFHLFFQGNRAAAAAEYSAALEIFRELSQSQPENLDLCQRLGATHYRIGFTMLDPLLAKESFSESRRMREKLHRIDTKDTQSGIELALVLARLGDGAAAETLVAAMLRQAGADRQVLFQAACVYGVLAGQAMDKEAAERFRVKAIQIIKDAIAAGWNDPGSLAGDPDFDALRDDSRFKELLTNRKAKP